jgi:hypothetical protein
MSRRVLEKRPLPAILINEAQHDWPLRVSGQPAAILRHPKSVVLMDTLAIADFEPRLDTMDLFKLYRGYL